MSLFRSVYDVGMDTEKRDLWDRLENEPTRAFHAFESFLSLPSGERTLLEAYRRHVGNPDAAKPSDTWSRWSSQFAWRERAAAYDDRLASMRREAFKRGIEEEAERQGVLAERNRNRFNELMTVGYEAAMRSLEEMVEEGGMRPADAIQITRLHFEAVKAFGVTNEAKDDDAWTEEDDDEFADLIKEVDEEEDSEVDSGEDDSESDRSDETE
jgi:hypothetical protein